MTSSTNEFRPEEYICQAYHIPPASIRVERLEGGITNLTCRLMLTASDVESSLPASFILKYATPYNYREGSGSPLSIYRQTVEARALEYLSGQSHLILPILPQCLTDNSLLRLPKLIEHDVEYNVLLMTDLGRCKSITDWLLSAPSVEAAARIANNLANFLLILYEATKRPSAQAIQYFSNPHSQGKDFQMLLGQLCRRFLTAAEVTDAAQLADRVERGELVDEEDVVLAMKDFWSGATIVNEHNQLCLVDFEYFGASDAASELGMFLHNIRSVEWRMSATDESNAASRAFLATFTKVWLCKRAPFSGRARRRFLLAYGRESTYAQDFAPDDFDPEHTKLATYAGAACLRAAGSDLHNVDLTKLDMADLELIGSLLQQ